MKRNEIRLTCDCQFSHGVVSAGTLVGVIMMHEPIDPISVLSMIQFGQASIAAVDSTDLKESIDKDSVDEVLDQVESETILEGPIEEATQEPEPMTSDLTGLLEDTLIEALSVNGIETKAQLLEFLASGKDLVDLDKIGMTRAKRILAAVEGFK